MPSFRVRMALYGLFILVSLVFSAFPIITYAKGGQNKDYGLWYATGRIVLSDHELYPTVPGQPFPFMYPPFAGSVLAILSELGPTGMLAFLVTGNIISWALAIELSLRLVAGTGNVPILLRIVPSGICFFYVYDMFLLGQPNLFLLVLVLAGFLALRHRHELWAGNFFAIATALKAFPAVILVYLLWRRYWLASVVMVIMSLGLVLVVPAVFRGFERNLSEAQTWASGMLFRHGERGVGQRPEQSAGWRNQSLLGVGHRLLRPVNAEADAFDPQVKPIYVNLLDLDYETAGKVITGTSAALGMAFIALMPRRSRSTRATEALEFAMLTTLVIIGTPYAFTYYFVWLLYPVTVLVFHAIQDANRTVRQCTWGILGMACGLMLLGSPITGHWGAAIGAFLWAALTILVGLGWHLWRASRYSTQLEKITPSSPTSTSQFRIAA